LSTGLSGSGEGFSNTGLSGSGEGFSNTGLSGRGEGFSNTGLSGSGEGFSNTGLSGSQRSPLSVFVTVSIVHEIPSNFFNGFEAAVVEAVAISISP